MIEWTDISSACSALDLLVEELEKTKSNIAARVAVSTRDADYDNARQLIAQAQGIDEIIEKTLGLKTQLTTLFDKADSNTPRMPSVPGGQSTSSSGIRLVFKKSNFEAQALYERGSVVVLSGSKLAPEDHASLSDRERKRRQKLQNSGKLLATESGRAMILKVDCRFSSPSAAASFVVGHATSGNRDWLINDTKEPLGKWIESRDR